MNATSSVPSARRCALSAMAARRRNADRGALAACRRLSQPACRRPRAYARATASGSRLRTTVSVIEPASTARRGRFRRCADGAEAAANRAPAATVPPPRGIRRWRCRSCRYPRAPGPAAPAAHPAPPDRRRAVRRCAPARPHCCRDRAPGPREPEVPGPRPRTRCRARWHCAAARPSPAIHATRRPPWRRRAPPPACAASESRRSGASTRVARHGRPSAIASRARITAESRAVTTVVAPHRRYCRRRERSAKSRASPAAAVFMPEGCTGTIPRAIGLDLGSRSIPMPGALAMQGASVPDQPSGASHAQDTTPWNTRRHHRPRRHRPARGPADDVERQGDGRQQDDGDGHTGYLFGSDEPRRERILCGDWQRKGPETRTGQRLQGGQVVRRVCLLAKGMAKDQGSLDWASSGRPTEPRASTFRSRPISPASPAFSCGARRTQAVIGEAALGSPAMARDFG